MRPLVYAEIWWLMAHIWILNSLDVNLHKIFQSYVLEWVLGIIAEWLLCGNLLNKHIPVRSTFVPGQKTSCCPFFSTKDSCVWTKTLYCMPSSRGESEQWCQSIPWCHPNSQRITVNTMWSEAKFNTFPLGYFTVWETEARPEVRPLYNFVSHSPDTLILEAGKGEDSLLKKSPLTMCWEWILVSVCTHVYTRLILRISAEDYQTSTFN